MAPDPASAPLCEAVSMPRASPLTTVTPRKVSLRERSEAILCPYVVDALAPTIPTQLLLIKAGFPLTYRSGGGSCIFFNKSGKAESAWVTMETCNVSAFRNSFSAAFFRLSFCIPARTLLLRPGALSCNSLTEEFRTRPGSPYSLINFFQPRGPRPGTRDKASHSKGEFILY